MTDNAQHFVGATTFQALSGRPVRTSLWDEAAEAAMGHIELARWPDRIVIAPATANTIARPDHGFAHYLVSKIGSASCRERVCPSVSISVDVVLLKKKKKT